MDAPLVAIALRLSGQDHALEPGRDYLLGNAPYCDLRLGGTAAAHQARVRVDAATAEIEDLGSICHTLHNGVRVPRATLAIGDVLRFGDIEAVVVADVGQALIVPVPALRAAARVRRYEALRAAAGSLRHVEEQTLRTVVMRELSHAPWFTISLAVHALLLLLGWLLVARPIAIADTMATASVALAGEPAGPDSGADDAPTVAVERGDPTFEAPRDLEPQKPEPVPEPGHEPPPVNLPPGNARITVKRPAAGTPGGTAPGDEVRGLGSGAFQRTVAELRKTGLEIVFVFDSTGSMTGTIVDTKTTIVEMLTVLRALVPDARFGLVTYRDRGPRERYLTQQMPLGNDFWRACNFVQFVSADGGGDLPEDVRAGLNAAFQQQWRTNARRVVVLAGDAPPHQNDWQKLLSEVRRFITDGRSFVHTIVTSPDKAGDDTHARFAEIAKAGKGTCTGLEARGRILQQVLTLAFGREFDQDVTTVTRAVMEADQRVDVQALAIARGGGPPLAAELHKNPVPRTLLNALIRRPRQAVVVELIDLLGDRSTPPHTRHAIAAVLQRVLELSVPPIDPMSDEGPPPRDLDRLRRATKALPD